MILIVKVKKYTIFCLLGKISLSAWFEQAEPVHTVRETPTDLQQRSEKTRCSN